MLDTARAIEQGAPPLVELRPDLPKRLLELVDRALSVSPARRPSAAELAHALRGAAAPRRKTRTTGISFAVPADASRIGAAALAGLFAGWTAAELPFFPGGFPFLLALAAAGATAFRPRLGVAVALAVPVFPLGNVSLGLALLYGALAAAWLVLSWREPRGALLFAAGPLLAPIALLGLVPLAATGLRAPARRAAQAAVAVVAAALAAGIRGSALPFTGDAPPLGVGVAGSDDPFDVAGTLGRLAASHPALLLEALVFAAVAVAIPFARARGRWGAAGIGAALLAGAAFAAPSAPAWPLVLCAWATAAAVAWRAQRVA
jgi:hypothetical protein